MKTEMDLFNAHEEMSREFPGYEQRVMIDFFE